MSGVQIAKHVEEAGIKLHYVSNRGKRVNGSNYILIEFGIVCNQSNLFAITLGHEESRGTPIGGFVTRHNDTRFNVPSYF